MTSLHYLMTKLSKARHIHGEKKRYIAGNGPQKAPEQVTLMTLHYGMTTLSKSCHIHGEKKSYIAGNWSQKAPEERVTL